LVDDEFSGFAALVLADLARRSTLDAVGGASNREPAAAPS